MQVSVVLTRIPDGDRTSHLIAAARAWGLPEMRNVEQDGGDDDAFSVSVLSGGITNQLYRVQLKKLPNGMPGPSVVVRVFGLQTERIISRESEMFYQSLFLTTYCKGDNFLMYRFLDGYRDIPFSDMPRYRREIAVALARYHFVATRASKSDVAPRTEADGQSIPKSRFEREPLAAVDNLVSWSQQLFSAETQGKFSATQRMSFEDIGLVIERVAEEVESLVPLLVNLERSAAVGVCHNDLLCANIMMRQETSHFASDTDSPLMLIDFEYSKKNFLLYDLANHFNEYVGLECDYHTHFPSTDVMRDAVAEYRSEMRRLLTAEASPTAVFPESVVDTFCTVLSEDDERRVLHESIQTIKFLTLASHLSWAIWALLQAAHSVIEFDFAWYGGMRWKRYLETKQEFAAPFL